MKWPRLEAKLEDLSNQKGFESTEMAVLTRIRAHTHNNVRANPTTIPISNVLASLAPPFWFACTSLQVAKMLIGNMLSAGDFVLDGLDLLFGFLNVVTFENPVRKPSDLLLGLVCNSIDLAHDNVPLRSGPVLCFVKL